MKAKKAKKKGRAEAPVSVEKETDEEPEDQNDAAGPEQKNSIHFGKRLAHTDKAVRDKGFKALKTWLGKHPELGRDDYRKLWHSLFFGFWMSDKRPVQQNLAVQMAVLLNAIPRGNMAMWLSAFWMEIRDQWEKLDYHRISKYSLLMRIVFAETLKCLRVGGWVLSEVRAVGGVYTSAAPLTWERTTSPGVAQQLCRVFWEELSAELEQQPVASQEVVLELLQPFVTAAQKCRIKSVLLTLHEHVLTLHDHAEYAGALSVRLLDLAGNHKTPKENRKLLYNTIEAMENSGVLKIGNGSSPAGGATSAPASSRRSPKVVAASPGQGSGDAKEPRRKKKRSQAEVEDEAPEEKPRKKKRRLQAEAEEEAPEEKPKKKKKKQGGDRPPMSPLMLPRAAIQDEEEDPKRPKKQKRRAVGSGS